MKLLRDTLNILSDTLDMDFSVSGAIQSFSGLPLQFDGSTQTGAAGTDYLFGLNNDPNAPTLPGSPLEINTAGNGVINGTADADILIGLSSNSPSPDTINGLGGDDVIIADHDIVFQDNSAGNGTFQTAINIDFGSFWSTQPNLDVGDDSIPYTTILATGAGEFDWFEVTVGAGETITLDMDYASGALGGPGFDSEIKLLADDGTTILEANDDASASFGGRGSSSSLDSYLEFTNMSGTEQTYYIRVEQFNDTVIAAGNTYILNVSVTGHANSNIATPDDDIVIGGDGNDLIYGGGGNDQLNGDADNDTIFGEDGDDIINGGDGDDIIEGGAGTDTLDGGAGIDTLSYASSSAAVIVNLESNSFSGGDAQGDVISGFENVIGSDFNDTIVASTSSNGLFQGGLGEDVLVALGGGLTLEGGEGNDLLRAQINFATSGATFDGGIGTADVFFLFGPTATNTFDLRDDTFINIEQIQFEVDGAEFQILEINAAQFIGSGVDTVTVQFNAHSDGGGQLSLFMDTETTLDLSAVTFNGFVEPGDLVRITGDADAETITGSSVNDIINGGAGADTINGGAGNDTINGGGGDDVIEGGAGADTLDGGSGIDTLSYAGSTGGVTVNFGQSGGGQTATGGDASSGMADDTISGYENFIGGSGDDVVTTNGFNGAVYTYEGRGGDDQFLIIGGDFFSDIDGGDDTDTLDFSGWVFSGVTVNLETELFDDINGGDQHTVLNVENVAGTNKNDNITGDGEDNVFSGNGGNDMLDGGDGTDTATFNGVRANYTITANPDGSLTITDNVGTDGSDTVSNIEILAFTDIDVTVSGGTSGNDNLTGTAAGDLINGLAGNDNLDGLEGDDIIIGGAGADRLIGGAGADALIGGDGFDSADYRGAVSRVAFNVDTGGTVGDAAGDTYSGIERYYASNFNDAITGSAANEFFFGEDGNDTINGGGGIDRINGGDGNDILRGQEGNDLIFGTAGGDQINGGTGFDIVSYENAASRVVLNLGSGGTLGDAAGDSYFGIEVVRGSDFDDILAGNNSTNELRGGDGDDILNGAGGNDRLYGGQGADAFNGGTGIDIAVYTEAAEGVGVDLAAVGFGIGTSTTSEAIGDSYSSIEWVFGSDHNDFIAGDGANNRLEGRGGDDILLGQAGNDRLLGGDGGDVIFGGDGVDTIFGQDGNDSLFGDAGNDFFFGSDGGDSMDGGADFDTVSYLASTSGVTVNLASGGTAGDAAGDSYTSIERVLGTSHDDRITGSTDDNVLLGNGGSDYLAGGAGTDTLLGGAGLDSFGYNTTSDGTDFISDFFGGETIYILGGDPDFDSFAELQAVATDAGANMIFDFGGGNTLTIVGQNLVDLDAGDFDFSGSAPAAPPPPSNSNALAIESVTDAAMFTDFGVSAEYDIFDYGCIA